MVSYPCQPCMASKTVGLMQVHEQDHGVLARFGEKLAATTQLGCLAGALASLAQDQL